MDERLAAIAAKHGVFLTSEALDLGYDDKSISAAVRNRLWHRVRRGAYTMMGDWAAADAAMRHRILCRAVLRTHRDRVMVSHVSSLVERGVATWGIDLKRVHVTRLDGGAGRIERDVVHHEGVAPDADVDEVNGIRLVRPSRGVVETLSGCDVERGLIVADSALNQALVTPDELWTDFRAMERWPGTRSLQLVLRLADARAESPGESRVRYICWSHGLPAPQTQFEVRDEHANVVAVTDFAWKEHGLLGEFDGRTKYGRLLKPGQRPEDVVFAEKEREDLVRELTGFGMVRFVWSHCNDPAELARRVRRKLRRAA
jgi:hypothetical protein